MIDAMRSFINTGMDALVSQQTQRVDRPEIVAKAPAPEKKIQPNNPAVEINLSPQAKALMKALEERRQAVEAGAGDPEQSEQQAAQRATDAEGARRDIRRPSVKMALDHILSQYGNPEYSADNTEKLDSLYLQLEQELEGFRQPREAAKQDPVVVDENTGYRKSLNTDLQIGAPMEGADGLTSMERIKSAILYSELDRILGGAGVFFGGDQLSAQLEPQVSSRAMEAKQGMNEILAGGTPKQPLTPSQEARIDAIYREISTIGSQAVDRQAHSRKQAVRNLIESNAGTRVVDAGNASLGG